MKSWIAAIIFGASISLPTLARSVDPVVIGVFSAYQSDVINNKIGAFVDGVSRSVRRPAYVITFAGEDSLRQLLASPHHHVLLFLPANLQAKIDSAVLTPLAQTYVPLALYARQGPRTLADLRRVSVPRAVDSVPIVAELQKINPAIEPVTQILGIDQLRTLVSGAVDGAVMSVGLYTNLAPSLRSQYVKRYGFIHRQQIVALGAMAFTPAERDRLRTFLLTTQGDVRDQLHQTFDISGFDSL